MKTEREQYISFKKKQTKLAFILTFIFLLLGAFLIYIDWQVLGGIILFFGGFAFFWNLYIMKTDTFESYLKDKQTKITEIEEEKD
jgi:hypothetical protein